MKYDRIMRAVQQTPWGILPTKLDEIMAFLSSKAADDTVNADDVQERFGEPDVVTSTATGGVGVIPIVGVLAPKMNMMTRFSGGTSLAKVTADLRKFAADEAVKAIVLDIDSPGGQVSGVTELANEILATRKNKPIVAQITGTGASAAFHLAAATNQIVAVPSAVLGSVGVIAVHVDQSKANEEAGLDITVVTAGKFKDQSSGLVPLTDEGRAEIQHRVDTAFGVMLTDIAKGRGKTKAAIKRDFGDARIHDAVRAQSIGMIDRIDTLEGTVKRLLGGRRSASSSSVAAALTDTTVDSTVAGTDDDVERDRLRIKHAQMRLVRRGGVAV